ncbi:MAG: hypothetical protein LBK47_09320 [Prevotellaceae bacterium]|jgi:hypothetical protein|nr:hypothetical protein [Prevotellaceae bacterium]
MDTLLSILFVFACIWLFFRLFGRYILLFVVSRFAKRFGIDPKQFSGDRKQRQTPSNDSHSSDTKGVVPDDMGEYVDFEDVE